MEGIEPYSSELQKLLFPLFAHIFLELLTAGQKVQGNSYILNCLCIYRYVIVILCNDIQTVFHIK